MSEFESAKNTVRERYGPRPSPEPVIAALFVGLAVVGATFVFRAVVVPDPDPSGFASAITVVAVAIATFGVQWWRCDHYDRRVTDEFLRK